ncbi:hypothetical protein H6F43_07070 [Leptolyngbya sp. FACHB-36]|uniref:hypothetical protein n=1 Tax=Leptolyngbya sp. FACHB-36 TaxID=2692808 RepID=UPI001681A312|nr:hypothetical protein [Leptolyngbya sp. FACHB-36]MBD2019948.1 hypothetical protein [Leptolyngbya sp. FACHB-36]
MNEELEIYYLDSKVEIQEALQALSMRAQQLADLSSMWGTAVFQLKNDKIVTAFSEGVVAFKSKDCFEKFLKENLNNSILEPVSGSSIFDELSDEVQDWLLTTIDYYRKLDFFQDLSALSNLELAQEVGAHLQGNIIEVFLPNFDIDDILSDLYLLSWDIKRVWWRDMEYGIFPRGNIYVRILEEWSNISRRIFLPVNVSEKWSFSEDIISIGMQLFGKQQRINLTSNRDWIDINLLNEVNELISTTGYQFVSFNTQGQDLCLVLLNSAEERKLRAERNLPFWN